MDAKPENKYLVLISESQRQILVNALADYNPPIIALDEADMLLGMFKGDGGLDPDGDEKDVVNDFTA